MGREFWRAACKRVPWLQRLSGLTLPHSRLQTGAELWIASLRASRASHSPVPARGSEQRMPDGSGPASRASFAIWDPASSSWRTSQGWLIEELSSFSGPWQRSGWMQSGTLLAGGGVGANHRRDRVFILGFLPGLASPNLPSQSEYDVAHPKSNRLGFGRRAISCRGEAREPQAPIHLPNHLWGKDAANLARVDDGIASRLDRIRACGNGVVPLAAAVAFRTLAARAGIFEVCLA